MYFSRSRQNSGREKKLLTFGEGVRDALKRRIQTNDWEVWKQGVVWISTYFTFGVWLSISMIFVRF